MVAEKNKTLFITVSFKEGAKDKHSKNTNHHVPEGIKNARLISGIEKEISIF